MKRTLVLVWLMSLCAIATAGPKPQSGEQYGDWSYQCAKKSDKDAEVCHITQSLTYKKDNLALLTVAIGQLPVMADQDAKPKEVLVAVLRLGILLTAGVELKVDAGEGKLYPIQLCLANGCHSYIELTEELLANMKRGNLLNVTFQTPQQQRVTVPVSLKGFSKAYATLKFLNK